MSTTLHSTILEAQPLIPGTCEWCGGDCDPADATCSLRCEAQNRRLEAEQGRLVIRTLKKWAMNRGKRGVSNAGVFTDLSKNLDRFNRNDRMRREAARAKARAEAQEEKAHVDDTGDSRGGMGVGRGHASRPGRGRSEARDAASGDRGPGAMGAGGPGVSGLPQPDRDPGDDGVRPDL